jgi:hypothetical protein
VSEYFSGNGENPMKVDCPKGWKWVKQIGHITFEDHRVNICDGICDSADLCGISDCEFYDLSQEATHLFLRAQAKEHSLEGQFPTIH